MHYVCPNKNIFSSLIEDNFITKFPLLNAHSFSLLCQGGCWEQPWLLTRSAKPLQTGPHAQKTHLVSQFITLNTDHNILFKMQHLHRCSYSSTLLVRISHVSCYKILSGLIKQKFFSCSSPSLMQVVSGEPTPPGHLRTNLLPSLTQVAWCHLGEV